MGKQIRFIPHAEKKFTVLTAQDFAITREQVIDTVLNPETIEPSGHRKRARKAISAHYHLNVVYNEDMESITVVTFFPSLRSRHESQDDL